MLICLVILVKNNQNNIAVMVHTAGRNEEHADEYKLKYNSL